ncbi:immunity 49 family protein [Streptomyces uncialis]|uniref:immunity 49 family protein n=1 Tax=Streptomyces uncialis TaxID=1048205 RepID=UPI003653F958
MKPISVKRHRSMVPEEEDFARSFLPESIEEIEEIEGSLQMMDVYLDNTRLAVQAQSLIDPRAAKLESWYAVVNAMQMGSAVFRRAAITEGTVDCMIHHKVRTLPAMGPKPFVNADAWLTAFFFAVVCRDQKRMTELAELPLDVLRASGAVHDEYLMHWVSALQAYWLRDQARLVDELSATFEKSHPDAVRVVPRDWVQWMVYPPVNLLYRFVNRDHAGFNEALAEALEFHKAYWTADEDRAESMAGVMALAPLAMTCLAYDGDFPIEVESDYLPHHLIARSWLGEFPT